MRVAKTPTMCPMNTQKPVLAVGLMSGTSLDGIDGVILRTDGEDHIEVVAEGYTPFHTSFAEQVQKLIAQGITLDDFLRLEQRFTLKNVESVKALLARSGTLPEDLSVIGFHGQTLRHLPDEGLTWQMGNASLLAQQTGIAVVNDFRRADMAAGGQGAPLIPLFHQALLKEQPQPCVALNIGGIANITYCGTTENGQPTLLAADTGPGMTLLNRWIKQHTGQPMDTDGGIALSGRIHEERVQAALEHAFFAKPLPRSADTADFSCDMVAGLSVADGAATLCAITVAGIMQTLDLLPAMPQTVWTAGGGVQHPLVLTLLRRQNVAVRSFAELGINPDMLEAACFAWLAVRRLRGLPTSLPATTGARKQTVGGLLSA